MEIHAYKRYINATECLNMIFQYNYRTIIKISKPYQQSYGYKELCSRRYILNRKKRCSLVLTYCKIRKICYCLIMNIPKRDYIENVFALGSLLTSTACVNKTNFYGHFVFKITYMKLTVSIIPCFLSQANHITRYDILF
jgi:hypothetical protein